MKTKSILGLAAVVLALATGGREAKADHVFQLVDVTFGPPFGGTATGTFTTNDAITSLLNYDITTSSVAGYPGFEYTPATAPDVFNGLPNGFDLSDSNRGPHFLVLTFSGGLTATGATIIFPSYEENSNALFPFMRNIVSGSVVGVPEPSSLVLGGLAAAAVLGLWAWRRRAALRDPGGDR
jgi:MYXO-CTERM domain-containing protein